MTGPQVSMINWPATTFGTSVATTGSTHPVDRHCTISHGVENRVLGDAQEQPPHHVGDAWNPFIANSAVFTTTAPR